MSAGSAGVPLIACVLAGGSGTRLYPYSRRHRPKQLLELTDERSLLECTLERAAIADERYVLTGETLAARIRSHVPEAGVLVEPASKGTGPALVYAAWRLREQVGECVVVCLPSDHYVEDDDAFSQALERVGSLALETDGIGTLGIEPTRPATAFGYIVPDDGPASRGVDDAPRLWTRIAHFAEKPDRETAQTLLEDGAYWNAGIFAWTPTAFLRVARQSPLAPLVGALEAGEPSRGFDAVDSISVDEAIMERTDNAYVTPLETGWDDLGTWDGLWRVGERDENETVALEDTKVLSLESSENVVVAPGKHVSLLDVEGMVVAVVDDRVFVAPREEATQVQELVERLRKRDRF